MVVVVHAVAAQEVRDALPLVGESVARPVDEQRAWRRALLQRPQAPPPEVVELLVVEVQADGGWRKLGEQRGEGLLLLTRALPRPEEDVQVRRLHSQRAEPPGDAHGVEAGCEQRLAGRRVLVPLDADDEGDRPFHQPRTASLIAAQVSSHTQ